jgi:hypothetical protein
VAWLTHRTNTYLTENLDRIYDFLKINFVPWRIKGLHFKYSAAKLKFNVGQVKEERNVNCTIRTKYNSLHNMKNVDNNKNLKYNQWNMI